MHASQLYWTDLAGWADDPDQPRNADLVLYFGSRPMLSDEGHHTALRARFPDAKLLGCSTGGQMAEGDVDDERLSVLALDFDHTRLAVAEARVDAPGQSLAAAMSPTPPATGRAGSRPASRSPTTARRRSTAGR